MSHLLSYIRIIVETFLINEISKFRAMLRNVARSVCTDVRFVIRLKFSAELDITQIKIKKILNKTATILNKQPRRDKIN